VNRRLSIFIKTVLVFSFFISSVPPVFAGKPGSLPALSGPLCKSMGGMWTGGQSTCVISASATATQGFEVPSGAELVINSPAVLTLQGSQYRIAGNGRKGNGQVFINSGAELKFSGASLISVENFGNIVIAGGTLSNSYEFTNMETGTIESSGSSKVNFIDNSYLKNWGFISFAGSTVVDNYRAFRNYKTLEIIGTFNNIGVSANLINDGTVYQAIINNRGILNNNDGAFMGLTPGTTLTNFAGKAINNNKSTLVIRSYIEIGGYLVNNNNINNYDKITIKPWPGLLTNNGNVNNIAGCEFTQEASPYIPNLDGTNPTIEACLPVP
jgi:hypothetical protein